MKKPCGWLPDAAGGIQRPAERRVLDAVEARRERADDQLALEHAVEVEAPGGAVIGRRRVVPLPVPRNRRRAGHGVVGRGRRVLEVGDEHAVASGGCRGSSSCPGC